MKIVENGKICSVAVYPENPDPTDKTAVAEYCLFARLCTNLDFDAFPAIPDDRENYVFIGGDNEHVKELGITVPREKFQDDTIYILVKDNYVVLDGGKRGKLYAVYEFLERFWGVRFYAPEKYKTPYTRDVEIKDCEIIYTPPFKIRKVFCTDNRWSREFCARNRVNASCVTLGLENFGGSIDFANPGCHTTFRKFLVPSDPDVGFEAHPEYYSYSPTLGKRVARHYVNSYGHQWGEGEICWTNPDVINIIIEKFKKWVLNDPAKSIFSISMNDWGPYCQCEECTRIANEQAVDGEPRWIAPILYCLNKVGKAIKEWQKTDERVKDRKILIETLAYHQATKAPKDMKIEDNIVIRFCTNVCNYCQFDDPNCPVNVKQNKDMEEWSKVTDNLYLWDYSNNFANPYVYNTVLSNIQSKYKAYAKMGIIGVFNEFNAGLDRASTWFYVRQYIYTRLLWNPDIDLNKEMKDAMDFFYGEGGPYMMEIERRFNECLHKYCDEFAKENNLEHGYHMPVTYLLEKMHLSEEFLNVAEQLFECALQKERHHDKKLAIGKEYALFKWNRMFIHRGDNYKEMDEVIAELEAFGVNVDNYKVNSFKAHYLGGKIDDFWLDSIAERNRNNYLKKLSVWM